MMNKNFLLLTSYFLLVFLSGCVTAPVEHQKEADFHYTMGISHLNEGNIQAAFVELQKAYQISPDNKEILNSLGLVYLHLEEFEKAKDLFLRAVSIDSEFSEAYNHLGVTYSRRGQWTESIEAFKKALLNPLYQTPEMAFYNLGMAYYRVGQYEPAINAFKDAIKRVPLFPLPYYGLALAYNRESRYGDAAAIIARAIEIDTAYKGDKKKFIEDIKQKLLTSKGDEESDFRDYLEIMRY
ncbi:MAG: tetratricopeptide repeat protein [Nitrospirae bacterium]|nr:tetratricopeptide repeat protein [Nitrospirota bacterium]